MNFLDQNIFQALEETDADGLDELPFGVVRMDGAFRVIAYNQHESQLSGLDPARVLGKQFFTRIAPCTNNFMVALKYEESEELDELVDYVFTFAMKPTKVTLRLLKSPTSPNQYLLVQRR